MARIGRTYPRYPELSVTSRKTLAVARCRARFESIVAMATRFLAALRWNQIQRGA